MSTSVTVFFCLAVFWCPRIFANKVDDEETCRTYAGGQVYPERTKISEHAVHWSKAQSEFKFCHVRINHRFVNKLSRKKNPFMPLSNLLCCSDQEGHYCMKNHYVGYICPVGNIRHVNLILGYNCCAIYIIADAHSPSKRNQSVTIFL